MSNKHGHYGTAVYYTWAALIQRCRNPKNPCYKDYGGRSITVCHQWGKFENFLSDMGEKPLGTDLDRIDNDRGYNRENCRWTSRSVNLRNRRGYSKTGFKGVRMNRSRFVAEIKHAGKTLYLGSFATGELAHGAYILKRTELYGY